MTETEALQRVPLGIVSLLTVDETDAIELSQVDDEGFPRCADVGIGAERECVADGDDVAIKRCANLHGLSASLSADEQVIEAAVGCGDGCSSAFIIDKDSQLGGGDFFIAIDEADHHRHVVGIPRGVDRREDGQGIFDLLVFLVAGTDSSGNRA